MSDLPNIVTVTDASFEADVLNYEGYVLVDFWAEWCHPCKLLEPEIEKIAEKAPDLRIAKFNVDENPEYSAKFNILSIPTMMLVTPTRNEEGKRRSVLTMGFKPFPQLKAWLKSAGLDLDDLSSTEKTEPATDSSQEEAA
jgi:thioredoxin 1